MSTEKLQKKHLAAAAAASAGFDENFGAVLGVLWYYRWIIHDERPREADVIIGENSLSGQTLLLGPVESHYPLGS